MKKLNLCFIAVLAMLLLSLFISGCGKKDSTDSSGSKDSKKETTNESKSEYSKKETTSGISSTEIDVKIDDYQKLLDEYASLVRDVKTGRMSEMAKLQEVSVKMSDWAKTFSEMAPQLTDTQKERIKKITENANGVMIQ